MSPGPLAAPIADGDATHRRWREGARAGLLAAALGALWSLLVDLVAGHPFATWYFVGAGLLSLFGVTSPHPGVAVLVFLAFVAAVFMLLGRIVVGAAHRSDVQPGLILLTNLLLTLLTLALVALGAAYATSRLGAEAWLQMVGSPVIALWGLAFRVYRTHPSVAGNFERASD